MLSHPTANTLAVMWRETARYCYQEQKWRRARAEGPGQCALSFVSFKAGAWVFRPAGSSRPLNRECSIAETSLTAMLDDRKSLNFDATSR
ncbi:MULTISPECIES: DUF3331 domain-containing protein [unclassified Caballeronia]|uniref:DUF3331 domain-containing protein n=1 Tax=unclassified Caballeronia TaxID=2646786 RepID=UPI003F507FE8